ncbi:MAG: hypothetical protein KJ771_01550, partial [Nanoarchaeota archaeon]|nr:hypothetical protein [Nanoarchaeota archaeon]
MKKEEVQKDCFETETYHEGENKILKLSMENCPFPPSIEYSELCMARVVESLMKNSGINIIVLTQLREYEYDFSQTSLLVELARLYKKLSQEERYGYTHLVTNPEHERYLAGSYAKFQRIISKRLKEDPLAAYIELKRLEVNEKIKSNNLIDQRHQHSQEKFVSMLRGV